MRLRTALLGTPALATTMLTTTTATALSPPSALDGSGPYSAGYETSLRLPNHTIYRPNTLPSGVKLPIAA